MENDLKKQELVDSIMGYLRETYKTTTQTFISDLPAISMINIDGKNYFVRNNKKFLVNKIFFQLPKSFEKLDTKLVRQTIKQFIDNII